MAIKKINPDTMHAPVNGAYAHIVIAGDHAHIAGQIALDVNGNLVGRDDHYAQFVQTFTNLKRALEAIDATPDQIVRMMIGVAKHRPERLEDLARAGAAVFDGGFPLTAAILFGVETLAVPEWLVELDATVYLGA